MQATHMQPAAAQAIRLISFLVTVVMWAAQLGHSDTTGSRPNVRFIVTGLGEDVGWTRTILVCLDLGMYLVDFLKH
jgi:hypothetical protein